MEAALLLSRPPNAPYPFIPDSLRRSSLASTINDRSFHLRSKNLLPPIRASAASSDSVVTLLDYGAGNVRSVRNAIRYLGFDVKDVQTPEDILNANRLVFPGVGAFAAAMEVLSKNGMAEALCTYIKEDRPFLGICLGLQLLFEQSEENGPGENVGLSILRRYLDSSAPSTIKVIACLDVRTNNRGDLVVTKGDQYDVREHTKENEVRNLGKPVELASQYYKDGADEVIRLASEKVFVPLTVGGGIRDFTDGNGRHYSSLEVASEYFRSGADKISIGSDAVYAAEAYLRDGVKTGKSSLEQISQVYGNQAVVVSIDPQRVYVKNPDDVTFKTVKLTNPGPNGEEYAWYQCTVNGGREGRPIGAYELAKAVEELGAGEILLNCIDADGQGTGFVTDLVNLVADAVTLPIIASSGAGAVVHFSEVFQKTSASAALAAGIFHRKEVPISSVKEHMLREHIEKWREMRTRAFE
ncbi:hypothetical protein QJS04_geneDACA000003 [Acorus gramineus]|uniref:imidazole glycerol-phosphate synthase n=1 Tax=Acorus gramineus TaxID=55184 RepID=A0AAV9ARE4_ACOGR|nr:hypothetical protein QJS04_geneDACA000003 [Acorus gramineus]